MSSLSRKSPIETNGERNQQCMENQARPSAEGCEQRVHAAHANEHHRHWLSYIGLLFALIPQPNPASPTRIEPLPNAVLTDNHSPDPDYRIFESTYKHEGETGKAIGKIDDLDLQDAIIAQDNTIVTCIHDHFSRPKAHLVARLFTDFFTPRLFPEIEMGSLISATKVVAYQSEFHQALTDAFQEICDTASDVVRTIGSEFQAGVKEGLREAVKEGVKISVAGIVATPFITIISRVLRGHQSNPYAQYLLGKLDKFVHKHMKTDLNDTQALTILSNSLDLPKVEIPYLLYILGFQYNIKGKGKGLFITEIELPVCLH